MMRLASIDLDPAFQDAWLRSGVPLLATGMTEADARQLIQHILVDALPAFLVAQQSVYDAQIPEGLDARSMVVYTIHCSHCGKARRGEDDTPSWWSLESLSELHKYELDGWHKGEDGRALVCPLCWEAAWCPGCAGDIHVWESSEKRDGEDWHLTCWDVAQDALDVTFAAEASS